MPDPANDRRRFHRIATDKPVTVSSNGEQHTGVVLDVSLRGMLFTANDGWLPAAGTAIEARIAIDGDVHGINMSGTVAHVEQDNIGLLCTSIDVDSATTLKRMVELNLGDHALLERDLIELVHD
ncbi:MAG: PilZ domain-containing protein [Gammaproteobacteria bacterium]|nr:PilZ domain-containing protein [Gammaproteobacteria bacterium]